VFLLRLAQIGHGFGLPHTDEDFFNDDLGECMDYTSNPGNNVKPGESNFIFLSQLYGTVPGYVMPEDLAARIQNGSSNTTEVSSEQAGGVRRLAQPASPRGKLPDWIMSSWNEQFTSLQNDLMTLEVGTTSHGRILHSSPFGMVHERHLGQGYVVRSHVLFGP
jgi:hypothetical protein